MKPKLLAQGIEPLSRWQIASRASMDIPDGSYVNLGIGLPTLIADYVTPGMQVMRTTTW